MPHPFDEISQNRERALREQERRAEEERRWEQRRKAVKTRFDQEIALIAPVINQVLEEFGNACYGERIYNKHVFTNSLAPRGDYSCSLHLLTVSTLADYSFLACARVGQFFIDVRGDQKDGSISSFSFGKFDWIYGDDGESGWGNPRIFIVFEQSTLSRNDVEQALLKLYRLENRK